MSKYVEEDDKSICGVGTKELNEIQKWNTILYRTSGLLNYIPHEGSVVDIGSGFNTLESFLTPNHAYYPCDITKRAFNTIVLEDQKLPFEDESIDCVVSINCFQHITIKNRMKYIKEIIRILKNGSMCFITFQMKGSGFAITGDYIVPFVCQEEIMSWLEQGLISVQSTMRNDGFTGVWFKKPL
jgi:SAM-dependent methyltransferase